MAAKRIAVFSACWLIFLLFFSHSVQAAQQSAEKSSSELQVVSHSFEGTTEPFPNAWVLTVKLNHPVSIDLLMSAVHLRQNKRERKLTFTSTGYSGAVGSSIETGKVDMFSITPSEVAQGEQENEVWIDSKVFSATGLKMSKPWKITFQSADTFTILHIEGSKKANWVRITFSDPVRLNTLRRSLKFHPYVYVRWYDSKFVGKDYTTVQIQADFKRGTTYFISIENGYTIVPKKRYKPSLHKFTVPDHAPDFKMFGQGNLIERDSRQLLSVKTINVDKLLVQTLKISPLILPQVLSDLDRGDTHDRGDTASPSKGAEVETLEGLEDRWQKAYRQAKEVASDIPELSLFMEDFQHSSEIYFNHDKVNLWNTHSIPLSFRAHRARGALEVIQLSQQGTSYMGSPKLFRISDLSLTVKKYKGGMLIWVTSLSSGAPQAGVSLIAFDYNAHILVLGKSDREGILALKEGSKVLNVDITATGSPYYGTDEFHSQNVILLCAATAEDVTYLELSSQNKNKKRTQAQWLYTSEIRSPSAKKKGDVVRGYVFTERGVYRPGETVHYKAVLREYRENQLLVPSEKDWQIEIRDARNKQYRVIEKTISDFGSFHGSLNLKPYDSVGTYTLLVRRNHEQDKSVIAQRTFEVQEFRPPRHFVNVVCKEVNRVSTAYVNRNVEESLLQITVTGTYYAGGAVKNGKVRWKCRFSGTSFSVKEYKDFRFGYPGDPKNELLDSGETMLDEQGKAVIIIPLTDNVKKGMLGIQIEASVIDFDGRVASTTEKFQVKPPFLVGFEARQENNVINTGSMQKLKVVVLDQKSRPIKRGKLKAEFYRMGWTYYRKQNENGDYYWTSREIWRKTYSRSFSLVKGVGDLEFNFDWGGKYLVKVLFTRRGKTYVGGTVYQVEGGYYGYYNDSVQNNYEKIDIFPDKPRYVAGDTIKVALVAKRPLRNYLLTFERGGILQYQVMRGDRLEVTAAVTDRMIPNMFVSVVGTHAREEFPQYRSQADESRPAVSFGVKKVEVQREDRALSVQFNEGNALETREPGQEMNLELTITDENGAPASAEVAVGVVDERVLALTRFSTPSLHRLLQYTLPLSVFTFDSRIYLLPQTPYSELKNDLLTGGGGMPKAAEIASQIRKDFNPVAYFAPALTTDQQGKVQVRFKLPDTMTTYRVYAVACDKGARFAAKQTPLTVVKKFYIQPGFPRFLRKGDSFTVLISALNKTDESGQLSLELHPDRLLQIEPLAQLPILKAYDQVNIPVHGVAKANGKSVLRMVATHIDQSDAVQITIPVQTPFTTESTYQFGTLKGKTSLKVTLPEKSDTIEWDKLDEQEADFVLTLGGSPFIKLDSSLKYLLRYPYGCVEQTSSILMPLAGLQKILDKQLIVNVSREQLAKFIRAGVNRLFSMQVQNGGFSYWPGGWYAHNWGTLYATTALLNCQDYGTELPESRMKALFQYLKKEYRNNDEEPLVYKAYIAYLLARGNSLSRQDFQPLFEQLPKMAREAALFTLYAAKLINYEETPKVMEELARVVKLPKSNYNGGFYANYRQDALALSLVCSIDNKSPLASDLARRLWSGMDIFGRWRSTSDTGWVISALADYFFPEKSKENRCKVTVTCGQIPVKTIELDLSSRKSLHLPIADVISQREISITTDSERMIVYLFESKLPKVDYAPESGTQAFEVRKEVRNMNGSKELKVGDIVEVKLYVTAYHYSDYVAIEDPLPACFVAINSALKTEEHPSAREPDESQRWAYWDNSGYYRLRPNFFEMRDSKVLVFRNYLWASSFYYAYYARVVSAGTFTMPPCKVQLMYQPETVGWTKPETIIVQSVP